MDSRILAGVMVAGIALLLAGSETSKNETGAFFTDRAASAGNTFTAGSWGGYQCNFILSSGTNDIVKETGKNATLLQAPDKRWSATGIIIGANWIWNTSTVDPLLNEAFTFNKTFYWFGPVDTANLQIAADNRYWVYLNGNLINQSPHDQTFRDPQSISLAGSIVNGKNILEIRVENILNLQDPNDNPAGLLYKLSINAPNCNGQGGG